MSIVCTAQVCFCIAQVDDLAPYTFFYVTGREIKLRQIQGSYAISKSLHVWKSFMAQNILPMEQNFLDHTPLCLNFLTLFWSFLLHSFSL